VFIPEVAMGRASRVQRFNEKYGPWAVVTGASSGIGRGIALQLAGDGLNLVLAGRNRAALDELAREVAALGREVLVVPTDLSRETGVEAIGGATRGLDVGLLVASAGFGTSGAFLDADLETELEMLAVNCRSLVALSWHFGRRFAERGRGGLVLMSSIVAFQGVPHAAHYAATKAYVQSLAEGLAVELAPRGVDVLASAPGPTASGFAARAGMLMSKAMPADAVAKPTLAALGRRTTAYPGVLTKFLTFSLATAPRFLRVRIMSVIMRGMTKHRGPK
jgi:short-subunit dehydrogenase